MVKTSVATVPTWEETETGFKATGYNTIEKKGNKYIVHYDWYTMFDRRIPESLECETEEEAKKLASQFPKNEKVSLHEAACRFKKVGMRFDYLQLIYQISI